MLYTIIYTLISIGLLMYIMSTIFNFLDVQFETYAPYLLFIIAIFIFYALLPSNKSNIFKNTV